MPKPLRWPVVALVFVLLATIIILAVTGNADILGWGIAILMGTIFVLCVVTFLSLFIYSLINWARGED